MVKNIEDRFKEQPGQSILMVAVSFALIFIALFGFRVFCMVIFFSMGIIGVPVVINLSKT
jgi:hypothetical protein